MVGTSRASVSSFGSAVGDEQAVGPAKADDDLFEDGQATWETFVLGLAYTVAKNKEETPRWFAVLRLAAEFLQLWLLVVNPSFGWQFDDHNKVFQLVSIINLKHFMGARGYSFYLAVMYIMFILLLAVVALSAYVGWNVQNNRLEHSWPVRLLRFFSATFCQVLDIAVLNLFLIALDCNYFDQDPPGSNREFPGAVPNCWVAPHLIHAGVAVVSLLIFIPLGLMDALSRMELNPTSRSWLAMNHSKTEMLTFGLKVAATFVCVFVTNFKWLSVCLGICALLLSVNLIRWVPYMHDWVNHARAASFTCVLFCAIVLTIVTFHPGVDWDDAQGLQDYRQKATDVLWAGMGPAICLGALFSYLRLRHFRVTVVGRFACAKPGTKPKYIHKFTDVRQVEIAARCCRHWIDQDTLEPGKVTLAEQIIRAGLVELPTSMFMIVLHSSFLIEVQSSFQSGYTELQTAKNKPGLLERYAIFIREQQHTQKAGNVLSFVETMRNYRMVHKAHKEALLATRAFWLALLHEKVSFHQLTTILKRLDKAIHVAERVYRSVLQRNSTSVPLLRIYTKFLEHVKHDPWSASKWAAEAARLHKMEEDRKNNILSDIQGGSGEEGQPAWAQHMAAVEEGKAVIIMDARCIIQAANQVAHSVFGYGKNELRGRNINILIPPPFAEHHDTYVKHYISTGRGHILDKTSEMVALHKEHHVFAVTVHVSKVMGMGMDSIFMGVLEAVPQPPNTATAWVMASGALLSVDATFTDMFGYRPEDLFGSYISSLMPEHKRLDETLQEIKKDYSRLQEEMEEQRAAQHARRMQKALTGRDTGEGRAHGSSRTLVTHDSAGALSHPPSPSARKHDGSVRIEAAADEVLPERDSPALSKQNLAVAVVANTATHGGCKPATEATAQQQGWQSTSAGNTYYITFASRTSAAAGSAHNNHHSTAPGNTVYITHGSKEHAAVSKPHQPIWQSQALGNAHSPVNNIGKFGIAQQLSMAQEGPRRFTKSSGDMAVVSDAGNKPVPPPIIHRGDSPNCSCRFNGSIDGEPHSTHQPQASSHSQHVHHHDHHHHHHRPRQQSTTSSVVAHVTAPSTAGYARALPNTRSSVSFISPGLEQQATQHPPASMANRGHPFFAAKGLDATTSDLSRPPTASTFSPRFSVEGDDTQSLVYQGATSKAWMLEGFHIRHKYADSLDVNLQVKNAGVGRHLFHVLQITQAAKARSDLMLVTDRQGRLQHVTQDLANLLGKTVHSLCLGGSINALEALMPEPFGLLHRAFLASPLPAQAPPHSCRTGAAIMLQGQGMDGPVQMPFKIRGMRKKEDKVNSTTQHVVAFKQVTLEEALDDRRLTLQVDACGIITKVGNAPPHLFGFDPQQLLGRCITSVVDCLASPHSTAGGTQPEDDDPQEVAHVVLQLAKRALAHPGVSWRAGVVQPLDPNLDLDALGEIGRTMLETERKTTPAVMAVSIHTAVSSQMSRQLTNGSTMTAESAPQSPVRHAHSRSEETGQQQLHGQLDSSPFASQPYPPTGHGVAPAPEVVGPASTATLITVQGEPAAPAAGEAVLMAEDEDYGALLARPATAAQPAPPEEPLQQASEDSLAAPLNMGGLSVAAERMVNEELRMLDGSDPQGAGEFASDAAEQHVAPAPAPSGAELGDETAAGEGHDLQQQPQAAPPAAERSPGNSNTRLPSASASTHQAGCGIMIEVSLWRADMLCGIMEVSPAGQIRATTTHKLNPPGLVLGCSDESLLSHPLSSFLPLRGKVNTLFLESLSPKEDKYKSLLKSNTVGAERLDRVAGPRHRMQLVHAGDQGILDVDVQIVRRAPPARNFYLLLHPVDPAVGRPDFREWLDSPGWDASQVPFPQPVLPARPKPPPGAHCPGSPVRALRRRNTNGSHSSVYNSHVSRASVDRKSHLRGLTNPPRTQGSVSTPPGGPLPPFPPHGPPPASPLLQAAVSGSLVAMGMPSVAGPRAGARVISTAPAPQSGNRGSHPYGIGSIVESSPKQVKQGFVLEEDKEALGRVAEWVVTDTPPSEDPLAPSSPAPYALPGKASDTSHLMTLLSGPSVQGPLQGAEDRPSGVGSGAIIPRDDPVAAAVPSFTAASGSSGDRAATAGALRHHHGSGSLTSLPSQSPYGYGNRSSGVPGHNLSRLNTMEGRRSDVFVDGGIQRMVSSRSNNMMEEHESSSEDEAALAEQDPQLIEAAAHLADEAGAPEPNSEEGISDGEGATGMTKLQGDFRRGHRFRKLYKRMSGIAFQRILQRFKVHSLALVALLFFVHIGMFALIYSLLGVQQTKVNHFSETGHGAAQVAQIATIATDIDIFLTNRTVRGLPGLDTRQDFVDMLDTLKGMIEAFRSTHEATYLGYGSASERLPVDFGLRNIWELNGTVTWEFFDAVNNTTPHQKSRNVTVGLWDAGNDYAEKALWVWQNWGIRANQTSVWGPYINWAAVRYVLYNGVYELLPAYYLTMDALAQLLIEDFLKVNGIQLVVMGVEGICLCAFVCVYMYILLNQVNNYRFALYNTFLLVPVGMSRALGHKPLRLDENDEDEDSEAVPGGGLLGVPVGGQQAGGDDVFSVEEGDGKQGDRHTAPASGHNGPSKMLRISIDAPLVKKSSRTFGEGAAHAPKARRVSLEMDVNPKTRRTSLEMELNAKPGHGRPNRPSVDLVERSAASGSQTDQGPGRFRQLLSGLGATFGAGSIASGLAGGKRKLQSSHRTTAWLLWPFALWGIILVALYMAAYSSIANISSPLATLNIVNFVAIRFTRTIFFAQQLAWVEPAPLKVAARAAMQASIAPFVLNYRAMLYGAAGVPEQTTPHFTEAKDGLAFVGGEGTDILYKPGTCLRANQSTCLTPDNPYYQFTVNGLDALMQEYFRSINIMLNSTGDEPTLNSEVFKYMWHTRPDILGGLDRLVAAYNHHLAGVYTYTLSLHIIAFVLTTLLLGVYLLFMWWPFLKDAKAETRHIAELLSQLPHEIKVDELVTRSVFARQLAMAGGASKLPAMISRSQSMASSADE